MKKFLFEALMLFHLFVLVKFLNVSCLYLS